MKMVHLRLAIWRRWSRAFIELAGTASDFPYPEKPQPAEPGPDFD
jgi:hypothetical protein